MSSRISSISGFFGLDKLRHDKRIFVFSVCLLIATALWFLDALSKNYTTTLSYNVKYVNPPESLFLANSPPSKIDLRVQAHGFALLRHKLAYSFSPILLDLTDFSANMDSTQYSFQVTGENLIDKVGNQISKELVVSDISPRSFLLKFDRLETKMVHVKPMVILNFKPQFNLTGDVVLIPDSVKISGPAGHIDTIKDLTTVPVTFNDLETRIEQAVQVFHPTRTRISPERVVLHVPVERFTEKKITLSLQIINLPKDVQIKLFPQQVTISFMVGLSSYESISPADFTAFVDFSHVASDRETLEVQVESKPLFIQQVKAAPSSVEYLIETE